MHIVLAQEVSFPTSVFVPLAVGFFGLGTGYLIYGPQELLKLPGRSRAVDLATGVWGIWMPGFMQLITGVYLFVGLAWLHSFREPPLYMAAPAFTAYGVHWWAIGMGRAMGGDPDRTHSCRSPSRSSRRLGSSRSTPPERCHWPHNGQPSYR